MRSINNNKMASSCNNSNNTTKGCVNSCKFCDKTWTEDTENQLLDQYEMLWVRNQGEFGAFKVEGVDDFDLCQHCEMGMKDYNGWADNYYYCMCDSRTSHYYKKTEANEDKYLSSPHFHYGLCKCCFSEEDLSHPTKWAE